MNSLVQDDVTRASTFFALAFVATAVGGLLLGDLRLGVELGFGLGVAFGIFAYFFVEPTATEADGGDEESPAGESPPD